jgi:hypothetical protein
VASRGSGCTEGSAGGSAAVRMAGGRRASSVGSSAKSANRRDIMASGNECRQRARRRQHICSRVFTRIGKMISLDSLRAASSSGYTLDTIGFIPHRRKGIRDEVWDATGTTCTPQKLYPYSPGLHVSSRRSSAERRSMSETDSRWRWCIRLSDAIAGMASLRRSETLSVTIIVAYRAAVWSSRHDIMARRRATQPARDPP